jgi:type I restriction enzyme S subunit
MKKYDSYKDSGIEWIGDIPNHWHVKRLKNIGSLYSGLSGKSGSDFEKVPTENFKPFINFTNIANNKYIVGDNFGFVKINENENQNKVKKNDLFFLMSSENQEDVGKSALLLNDYDELYLNSFCKGFRLTINSDARFINYLLTSSALSQLISLEGRGFTRINLRMEGVENLPIILPQSIEEQTNIANYLDNKTAKIDDLISKKKQFIQLLEEERVAVINQSVTKGLDPSVSMKDSGVEWLGEIPEHWESYRIDWVANIVRGNTGFRKDELLDSGEYVALQYGKTYKVDIVDDSFNFFVNSEFYKESQIVSKGDTILISTSETIEDLGHACYYINENKGLLGGEQILLKPNRSVLYEKYLYQYVRQFCRELQKYAKGLKVFRFSTHDLKQIFIAIPKIEEQIKIVDFLDLETIRIDSLTSKMEKEIELLKEYKTALISEVVTGKVDVRNEKNN